MHNYKLLSPIFFLKLLSVFSCQLYSSNQEVSQAGPDACCLEICSNLINCTCCKGCDCLIQQQEARTRYGICSLGCHSCKECVCFMHNNDNQIEQRKGKLNDVCLSLQSLCCYSCITLCTCNKSVNCISCFCDPLCANDKYLMCAGTLGGCEPHCQTKEDCVENCCCCCWCRPYNHFRADIKPVDPFRAEMK